MHLMLWAQIVKYIILSMINHEIIRIKERRICVFEKKCAFGLFRKRETGWVD